MPGQLGFRHTATGRDGAFLLRDLVNTTQVYDNVNDLWETYNSANINNYGIPSSQLDGSLWHSADRPVQSGDGPCLAEFWDVDDTGVGLQESDSLVGDYVLGAAVTTPYTKFIPIESSGAADGYVQSYVRLVGPNAINDAAFLGWSNSETPGVPATILLKLKRFINSWFFTRTRDRSNVNEIVETDYAVDGTTPLVARTQTTAGDVDTVEVGNPVAP